VDGTEDDESGMDTGRVLALSDGVFAIAGTLLVLDLKLPPGLPDGQLGSALAALAPALRAYAISFALIGMFWYGHHAQFRRMKRLSVPVVALNLVLLGLITGVPFTTQLMSEYGGVALSAALYAANMAGVVLLESAIGYVALRRGDADEQRAERGVMVGWPLVAGCVFLASVPVALVAGTTWASLSWLVLPAIGVGRRVLSRRRTPVPDPT
jgi:uncharacterized membrane protein